MPESADSLVPRVKVKPCPARVSETTITVKNNSCAPGGFENLAVHGSVNGIRRTTSSVNLHSTAAGDFNIGVGAPSPAVLVPPGGVSYAVTVSSSNGQAGAVSLSLDTTGLPAGVTYSFSPSRSRSAPGARRPVT